MQRKDYVVGGVVLFVFGYLLLAPGVMDGFIELTKAYPYRMSFIKFALLATLGECIALRITTGVYNRPGFGIVPKFFVWGILGVICKLSFTLFGNGTPAALAEFGIRFSDPSTFFSRFVIAFFISAFMNTLYAPLFMTAHKISDLHIAKTGGSLRGFFSSPDIAGLLHSVDWTSLWGFVFKKTLPFFWIPAHTITFLLPGHFQVLFAAILSIALGVILAFAGLRAKK